MASRAGLIAGNVCGADGKAIPGARVLFSAGPGALPDIAALSGSSGEFMLAAPAEGSYTIEVAADGFQNQSVTVTIAAGQTKELRIALASSQAR